MTENLPVNWQEQMKADAKSLMEVERPTMGFMSLKAGQMTINGEAVPGNEIDCIIVASATEMSWYADRYDPDVKANPNCYALGEGKAETLVPYDDSPDKQAPACVDCPKFEWGSDPNGGRGKACKERRRLAIIPANGSAEMVTLSIPPTSLKGWAQYARGIIARIGQTPAAVITKLKVVPDAKVQFRVTFTEVSDVPLDQMPYIMAKKAVAMETLLAPYPPIEEEEAPKAKKKAKY